MLLGHKYYCIHLDTYGGYMYSWYSVINFSIDDNITQNSYLYINVIIVCITKKNLVRFIYEIVLNVNY